MNPWLTGRRSRPLVACITGAGYKVDGLVREADGIAHPVNKHADDVDAKRIADHEPQLPLSDVVRQLDAAAREALQGHELKCAQTPGAAEGIVQLVAGVASGEARRLASIKGGGLDLDQGGLELPVVLHETVVSESVSEMGGLGASLVGLFFFILKPFRVPTGT